MVEGSDPIEEDQCLCSTYPEIEFFHGTERLMKITVHHSSRLGLSGIEKSGDYDVGNRIADQVVEMALHFRQLVPDPIVVDSGDLSESILEAGKRISNQALDTTPDSRSAPSGRVSP